MAARARASFRKIFAASSGSMARRWQFTSTARSAPMASAVRSWFCTSAGPMDTTTTSSARPFSFSRRASSRAISSKGLMLCLTPFGDYTVLSGFTRIRML